VADAKLNIIISAKDQASGAIKGVGKSLQSLGGTVLKGAAVGLGAAAAGLAAVGAGAVKLAADAAPLQGVQDAFDGITEAAGTSGDAMLKALQEGSAGMITNRDLMTSFNKAAQLVSVDFAQTLGMNVHACSQSFEDKVDGFDCHGCIDGNLLKVVLLLGADEEIRTIPVSRRFGRK